MRIDAHHHLWDPAVVEYPWLGPELAPIGRAFHRSDLEGLLCAHAIDATVVIQAANSAEDTDYLLGEADACDWIAAVVGWVDLRDREAVERRLHPDVRHPKLRGIRHLLDAEPTDWPRDASIRDGLAAVAECGLVLDVPALFPRHLEAIPTLAGAVGVHIVIDHLGSPPPGSTAFDTWARELMAAARYSNVHAKLSGLRTVIDDMTRASEEVGPCVEHALAVFGADRLMWGSDWPVSLLAGDYQESMRMIEDALDGCSSAELEAIFGGTAARLYGIVGTMGSRTEVPADE